MVGVKAESYEVIVEPSRGWFAVDWREFWEYRDLLAILIQRDITSRYKQTLLGPLWFIAQPVLTALVFAVVFGRVAGIPTDGIPGPLFYLCGLSAGLTFRKTSPTPARASSTTRTFSAKCTSHGSSFRSPSSSRNLVAFAIQLVPFLLFLGYYALFTAQAGAVHLSWKMLLASCHCSTSSSSASA